MSNVKKDWYQLDLVVHALNPSNQEVEAGGSLRD